MPEHEHRTTHHGAGHGMQRKVGPLKLWQWVAIGTAAVLVVYIYRQRKSAAAQSPASAQDLTGAGPIDPATGLPYSQESGLGGTVGGGLGGVSGGGGETTGQGNLAQELQDLQAIQGLQPQNTLQTELGNLQALQGLQQGTAPTLTGELNDLGSILGIISQFQAGQQPTPPASDGSAGGAATDTVSAATGAAPMTTAQRQAWNTAFNNRWLANHPAIAARRARRHTEREGDGNLHTHHGDGRQTVSSHAPANGRQHHQTPPAGHQRHNPTKHPSKPHRHPHPATNSAAAHAREQAQQRARQEAERKRQEAERRRRQEAERKRRLEAEAERRRRRRRRRYA